RRRLVPHARQSVRRGTRAVQQGARGRRAATGAGVPVHAGTVRRGRPGRGIRLRRAALPAPRLPAPRVRPPRHPGGRTGRRLRAVAGDVRGDGPAVPPGLALRPRGRLRARRLPAPALQRRTPRGRRPPGLLARPAAGTGGRGPALGIDAANPPAAPEPPQGPTELEEPAVPAPYDPSPF